MKDHLNPDARRGFLKKAGLGGISLAALTAAPIEEVLAQATQKVSGDVHGQWSIGYRRSTTGYSTQLKLEVLIIGSLTVPSSGKLKGIGSNEQLALITFFSSG